MLRAIFVGLIVFSFRLLAAASVIVVDPAGAGQFTEIQPALDAAEAGDTVLVKPGEYILQAPITFPPGAITLRSEAGAEQTILRAVEGTPAEPLARDRKTASQSLALQMPQSVGVHFGPPVGGAVLNGFTITQATYGVYITDGFGEPGPVVKRCRIQGNLRGVVCQLSDPQFFDCTIEGNAWGGLDFDSAHPVLVRSTISGNQSEKSGGGISGGYGSVTLTDCKITGNTWSGIHLDEAGSAGLLRCEVSGNGAASGQGGAPAPASRTLGSRAMPEPASRAVMNRGST